ncbi:hypothetical protein KUTeg_004210 [Tegillarca granosa]|uniref:PH domain-containing protein n=1 Tax=Tegillarca granosa TaxID=220873 RepID=A0ABQ9FPB5_TEGGR|nr:hypothetical protein KUTeg_004210 [Tegillarca granosa]
MKMWLDVSFPVYNTQNELNFYATCPDTVPQGCLDMNKCTEVKDAENTTSHPFSLAITVPGKKTLYIKGNSKEEIMWWRDVLSVFPMNLTKPKNRRFTMPIFSTVNKENVQPDNLERKSVSSINDFEVPSSKGRFEVEKVKQKEGSFSTYRGVRNMKHNKTDKHYQEGLRKSSSLHDLTSKEEEVLDRGLAASQYLSHSGDRIHFVSSSSGGVDPARILADANYNNPYFTIPRRTWQTLAGNVSSPSPASSTSSLSSSTHSSSQQAVSPSPPSSALPANRRGSFDSKNSSTSRPSKGSERAQLHRERSRSLKDFPSQLSLPKAEAPARKSLSSLNRLPSSSSSSSREQSLSVDSGSEQNETDELKSYEHELTLIHVKESLIVINCQYCVTEINE